MDKVKTNMNELEKAISSNQEFQLLLQNVVCGICIYTVDENNHLQIEYMSEGYCELCESTQEELKVAYMNDPLYGVAIEDQATVVEFFQTLILTGEKSEISYRATTRTNKRKWCSLRASITHDSVGNAKIYATFFDITKDKNTEEKLRESEQSIEIATENAGLWYWVYHLKTDTVYLGNKIKKEYGLPSTLENFSKLFPRTSILDGNYIKEFIKLLERIKAGEKCGSIDVKGYLSDGSIHWARILLTNIFDSQGNPVKAVGTMRIIDEVKALEEKYEVEKRRGLLDDKNLISKVSFNLSRQIILDSTNYEMNHNETFNVSNAVIQSIPDQNSRDKLILIHDGKYLLNKFEEGIHELTIDYRRKMSNGKIIWVRNLLHLVREPDGRDVLLFEYCYNIDKQKTLESMMDFAVNDDYDLIGCVNLFDNLAIMKFGQNSYNVHDSNFIEEDYTKSLDRFTANAVVPEERELYYSMANIERVKEKVQESSQYEFYFHMFDKFGDIRAKKVKNVLLGSTNDLIFFTQTDITSIVNDEQRKQNELKEALQAANMASKSKTTFLSQMSHEIRTPMNAIIGMSKLANESNDLQTAKKYIEKIDYSSKYLLGILNDILDMSQIESGKFKLKPAWINSNEILWPCIDMLKPEIEKKKINFVYPSPPTDRNLEYYIDGLRLKQVFMNILNNSVKFTPEGGTIKISFSNMLHDEVSSVDKIIISDTGCGMSQDFMNHLFQPFEQEANPYSTMVQGTGLGLAIVKEVMDKMGGTISVESEINKGTTFHLTIPYKYRFISPSDSIVTVSKPVDLSGKRILLTDDHPLNRQIASILLKKKGAIIFEATDGQEALDKFKASPIHYYDAILMDIRMPVMDGLEATRAIRGSNRLDSHTVPIIAMTANAFNEDELLSKKVGMNAHLSKPIEPELLFKTLMKFM